MIQQERIIEECVDELIELIDNTRKTAFGSADFQIISFNDILQRLKKLKTMQLPCRKNVLAFCRKIMCGAIAEDYEHRYNKKLFERIKHHGTSR